MADTPNPNPAEVPLPPTRDLARYVTSTRAEDIDEVSLRWARHCLLDWLAVTMPGASEDLVSILVAEAFADEAEGSVPLVGRSECLNPSWAILVNGSASHALDYDDVNRLFQGHPTVAVLPAILVAGAVSGKSVDDVLRSFVVGYEVGCLIGEMTGTPHYDTGWHATATIGTFGAAAGVAHLMGLDEDRAAHALGTAATMAAGLKSMFGTMCKPMHAGRAAQSGYLAARMAARGWVSRDDALECGQGFWDTQGPGHAAFPVARQDNQPFQIQNNLFKYHAACYMTHSAIEACRSLHDAHAIPPEDIRRVRVKVAEQNLKVCNILEPDTGLEVKFSLRHTAAMGLKGLDTAAIDSYSDEIAQRPDLVDLRRKVEIEPRQVSHVEVTGAEVVIETDGATYTNAFNVGLPASDVDVQEQRLIAKYGALMRPLVDAGTLSSLKEMALTGTPTARELLDAARVT
ncbi:MAG: MmgE/PrpD family protein [Pseudomonadota bacterium]